jgi:hypothetical protein
MWSRSSSWPVGACSLTFPGASGAPPAAPRSATIAGEAALSVILVKGQLCLSQCLITARTSEAVRFLHGIEPQQSNHISPGVLTRMAEVPTQVPRGHARLGSSCVGPDLPGRLHHLPRPRPMQGPMWRIPRRPYAGCCTHSAGCCIHPRNQLYHPTEASCTNGHVSRATSGDVRISPHAGDRQNEYAVDVSRSGGPNPGPAGPRRETRGSRTDVGASAYP